MKKALLIGCIVISIVGVIALVACGIISYQGISGYMGNNTKVAEEILGSKIPEGYIPIIAMNEMQGKGSSTGNVSFAMLMKATNVVVLIAGPRIMNEQQKLTIIESFKSAMRKQNKGMSSQKIDIEPDGTLTVKDKSYPKYKVTLTQSTGQTEGVAVFIDYPDKTLLFVYMSESQTFDPDEAKSFLEKINLPSKEIL